MNNLVTSIFVTLLTTILLSTPVRAQLSPAMGVEDAKKQAEVKCIEACLILSKEDLALLEQSFKRQIQKAYEAGVRGWASHAKTN